MSRVSVKEAQSCSSALHQLLELCLAAFFSLLIFADVHMTFSIVHNQIISKENYVKIMQFAGQISFNSITRAVLVNK